MAWKNWGDHPIVVVIGIVSGLSGLGYAIYDHHLKPEDSSQIGDVSAPPSASTPAQPPVTSSSSFPSEPVKSISKTPTPPKVGSEISPVQFMQNYYKNINNNQISKAWKMLTPQFQVQSSSSYSEFYNWWNSIDSVQVEDIYLISQNTQVAIIEVQTAYVINGRVKKEKLQHFTLTWGKDMDNWQISDRRKFGS